MPEARGSADADVVASSVRTPSPGPADTPAAGSGDGRPVSVPLDDVPDGLVLVGADGVIVAVNRAAVTLLGREHADLVGVPVRKALPLQDTSGRRWWDVLDPESERGHPERLLLLPGGRELLVTTRFVRSGAAGTTRMDHAVVALRGTDERRRAESDAQSLIATVAHELRSPLTSVKQFTATLLRRWEKFTDEQKRLMLSTVEADADRVTRLVGDLLDVSRVDAGRLQVHRVPMDLATLVREHVDRLVTAGFDDDRFRMDVAAAVPELWADPDRMAQVVTNLVDNAVRHGAGTITIALAHDPALDPAAPGDLLLTVDDEGDGIPAENRPYVFSKFWHGGQRSGTGLGLYVTRGLVEAHGGDVEVGASPTGGARFSVRLPGGEPEPLHP